MVETVAVVVEAGFGIVIFCRETMAEETGERAGLRDGVAEGIVGVLCDRIAVGVKVARDISVIVIERNINCAVDCEVE